MLPNIFNEEKNIKIFPTFKLNIAPWKTSIIRLSINERSIEKIQSTEELIKRFYILMCVKDIENSKKFYENYRSYA